jgi:acyl-CoA synthetase (AMP-forming)/AMP-acid ligase II
MAEGTVYVSGSRPAGPVQVLELDAAALERDGRVVAATPGADLRRLVSCGRVPANLDLRIVDAKAPASADGPAADARVGRPLPAGRIGEIWVSGPSIGQGYWQQPQATQERFGGRLDGTGQRFLRTGDLGFLYRGELFVVGRADDLVIVDGRNHFPQDIEDTAAASHWALAPGRCVAFATREAEGSAARLVLVAETIGRCRILPDGEEPSADRDVTALEITRAVGRRIAEDHHLGVATVVLLRPGVLPRTTSGKVQRRLTRRLHEGGGLTTW